MNKTCADCIHYEVCREWNAKFIDERLKMGNNCVCKDFKPKSRYIELPCAVGDVVYVVESYKTAVIEYTIAEIRITKSFIQLEFTTGHTFTFWDGDVADWLNKYIFLTKEEAEQALKGGDNNA